MMSPARRRSIFSLSEAAILAALYLSWIFYSGHVDQRILLGLPTCGIDDVILVKVVLTDFAMAYQSAWHSTWRGSHTSQRDERRVLGQICPQMGYTGHEALQPQGNRPFIVVIKVRLACNEATGRNRRVVCGSTKLPRRHCVIHLILTLLYFPPLRTHRNVRLQQRYYD